MDVMREQYLSEREVALDLIGQQLDALALKEGFEVPLHDIVSAFRKADPGMSTRAAKHFILRAIEEKDFSPNEYIHLPRLRAVMQANPMHRFTAFTSQEMTARAMSPSPKKSKVDPMRHLNYHIEHFVTVIRKTGPVTYHGLEPPTLPPGQVEPGARGLRSASPVDGAASSPVKQPPKTSGQAVPAGTKTAKVAKKKKK